jgi:hypothetical protein
VKQFSCLRECVYRDKAKVQFSPYWTRMCPRQLEAGQDSLYSVGANPAKSSIQRYEERSNCRSACCRHRGRRRGGVSCQWSRTGDDSSILLLSPQTRL